MKLRSLLQNRLLVFGQAVIERLTAGAFAGVVGEIDTHEGYGAVFQKDSPLIPFVSKAINKLQKDGTISKLTKHWFGFDPSKVPVLK